MIAPSIALPQPRILEFAEPSGSSVHGFTVESTPRRMAFQAALRGFLEVTVRNTAGLVDVFPDQSEKRQKHFENMYRNTIRGLLLAGNDSLPAVFCLHNSLSVATLLPELIAEVLGVTDRDAVDPAVIYSSVRSYAGSIWHWTASAAAEVAMHSFEAEVEVFPHLLTLLRDNVLIFAHAEKPTIWQLGGYAESLWGLPGEQFLERMRSAENALRSMVLTTPEWLRDHLELAGEGSLEADWPGVLARFADNGGEGAPSLQEAAVWEELHRRLRQFDILDENRRQVFVVERDQQGWVDTAPRPGAKPVHFAAEQRPMSIFSGESAGLTVQRFGLRYDITNFSSIMASLEVLPTADRETALRKFFFFQRRVQAAARRNGMVMEKHFGDGVLFSSNRSARTVLAVAVEIQRAYRHAVDQGMVFSGGMRLAANWGAYRLVASAPAGRELDGQLFGPGIVEISRLVSGKVSRNLQEVKKLLVGAGYQRREVNRFFSRFEQRQINLVDEATETRRFWAYVNPNGTLVNEGIVITAQFLARLIALHRGGVGRFQDSSREFLVMDLSRDTESQLEVGVSHRGFAEFKGLAPIEVFEVVDRQDWGEDTVFEAVDQAQFPWLPEPIWH